MIHSAARDVLSLWPPTAVVEPSASRSLRRSQRRPEMPSRKLGPGMSKARSKRVRRPRVERGNFVSEWFGYRVHPSVVSTRQGLRDQKRKRCPFLSTVIEQDTDCVKAAASSGICSISSTSNGPRQDWLVCPYRALDPGLLDDAARRLFSVGTSARVQVIPAPMLSKEPVRRRILETVRLGGTGVAYFQDKLGGEISLSATARSPEFSFDSTLVEIRQTDGRLSIGRYGILEVQTMDFHGSYRHVVKNLEDALRLHKEGFAKVLRENPGWLSERIEGPNISNVFKRTFYQMAMKFQVGAHAHCAGCVVAIPASVWDSWQRHLGGPALTLEPDGTFTLEKPGTTIRDRRVTGWIYVFDVQPAGRSTPDSISILKVIATNAEAIAYYALKVAPEAALEEGGSADRLLSTIRSRLAKLWPELIQM